ncbi:hypothetical protein CCB80_10420 [Armatimonadetes bacterium Uphvl-Ar1]|nr:hypothetical protein CCB80_10420 [Armatimonadetes bacterium Uphvl-Ar1]
MARLTGVDVSVFDVGGVSVLADLRQAEVVSSTQFADVTPVILAGESRAAVKQSVRITNGLMSSKPGGAKVTHLDISALSVAGLDYRTVAEQGVFEGRMEIDDGSGIGDEWEWPVVVRKDYRARLELMVDSAGSVALVGKAFGGLAGKDVGFSVTINGSWLRCRWRWPDSSTFFRQGSGRSGVWISSGVRRWEVHILRHRLDRGVC